MSLSKYRGKKIKLILKNGEIVEGKCVDYTQALDNDPEIPSVTIDNGKDILVMFYEDEIKSIEIAEE